MQQITNMDPCPFCGEHDKLWVGYASPYYEVRCLECGGAMRDEVSLDAESAVRSWNKRSLEKE